ncbi:Rho small monomeric GTPase [Mycena chlorophos]|uniref:Rho small monomeric GTPase n=1 Tax=Mycena chlorophos TaxID=658473 RepID=A0A8H6W1F8_MYCCL|nr:Rho small monomeric GTPase [Mycena chlorophos]
MSASNPLRRKLVIVGDGMQLGFPHFSVCAQLSHQAPAERHHYSAHSPSENFLATTNPVTVFDNYVAEIRLDDKPVQLALWDTAGQEEYERLRPMSYSKSHVILIAFALDTPDSLENWIEEVRSICGPTIPVILVGCKADLRPSDSHPNTPDNPCPWVTREQGERTAQAIGARAYKECSALKIEGVDEVFEAATRASMLMRDGVPGTGETKHHRRKSSGKGIPEKEESGGCCVVC